MKKYLILLISIFIFTSCVNRFSFQSNELPLRQLVSGTDTSKYSSGWFFIAAGGYSSGKTKTDYIKMYALVDGAYKYLEYDMRAVRIAIDNSIIIPYIKVYSSYDCPACPKNAKKSDEWLTSKEYFIDKVVLYTPEQHLPEYLVPIKLK